MADDAAVQPPRPPGPGMRRAFLAASAGLSALIMVVSAFGMGAYFWTRSQIETFDIDPPPRAAGATETPVPDVAGRCAERACNYLLLGSDSREGLTPEEQEAFGTNEDIGGENRADTIILVHTEPDRKEAVFLSFPRDLWVEIPGVGMGRINSAFEGGIQGGGPLKVARTVKQLTGMQIHHVLYVDLAGFQGLVEALGGVEMCVPYPMQDPLTGLDIPAGCQTFDGFTALAYVRTRHQPCDTVPDFARISRQQQFLRAVISKLLRPGELLRLPSLVPELLDNLVVDEGLRNPAELVYLAGQLNGVNTGAAEFRSVPTIPAGTYVNGRYLSIVKMVQPDAGELFRRIRDGKPLGDLGTELSQTAPSPANIVVAVYDKAVPTASAVFEILTRGGFNTSPGILARTGIESPRKGSMILFQQGEDKKAEVVQSYFRNLEVVAAPPDTLPSNIDVAVVLTGRYALPEEAPTQPAECP